MGQHTEHLIMSESCESVRHFVHFLPEVSTLWKYYSNCPHNIQENEDGCIEEVKPDFDSFIEWCVNLTEEKLELYEHLFLSFNMDCPFDMEGSNDNIR